MCICINCKHADICKTYKFIEKQHNNYKINRQQNCFIPMNTMIIVSINKKNLNIYLDWDIKECSSFVEQPGKWISLL
uniref:hypothetical protein n=1 Tax=Symphyocladia marchantioides TaxID=88360 RepID=UPI0022FD9C47|nr:hypothetical protein PNW48_pgp128 [Symphyocladia marchantioides]WAX03843.1 hypothetical protein [Symphyocladia marchantioides]